MINVGFFSQHFYHLLTKQTFTVFLLLLHGGIKRKDVSVSAPPAASLRRCQFTPEAFAAFDGVIV